MSIKLPHETERLLLRPFERGDLDALFDIHSKDEVHRYLYSEPLNMEQAKARLARKIANTKIEEHGDALALAVVLKTSGALIGDLTLQLTSAAHKQGEIGFIIHPDHHGKGYASEAARYLLEIAFRQLGLHRVYGQLEARNTASARVLGKLGMRQEGLLIENEFVKGEWQSEIIYAILDREWLEKGQN